MHLRIINRIKLFPLVLNISTNIYSTCKRITPYKYPYASELNIIEDICVNRQIIYNVYLYELLNKSLR